MQPEITPQELQSLLQSEQDAQISLLDVRSPEEHVFVNLESHNIPLDELHLRTDELNPDEHIIAYCHHGVRSAQAVSFLQSKGFKKTQNLKGGIDLWAQIINPEMLRY